MKGFVILFILVSNFCYAQNFRFDKKIYEAVDHWVVFDKQDGDSTYMYGFIYIDQSAGFTFHFGSRFSVRDGVLVGQQEDLTRIIKSRLSANTYPVHILTDVERQQLKLPEQPDWLKLYKANENTLLYKKSIGLFYNSVGASDRAIPILMSAYDEDPNFAGLVFELAYAYNATQQYNYAIEVLDKAIQAEPTNFWLYRELGYAYKQSGDLLHADSIYRKGISLSNDKAQQAEMGINMVQAYYEKLDRKNFDEWLKITRQYAEKGTPIEEYLSQFEVKDL